MRNNEGEGGNAADNPDLTPPGDLVNESTPPTELNGENLAGVLAAVFDKAREFGINPGRGVERVADYLEVLAAWDKSGCRGNTQRSAALFAALERAHAARDHLAMLDAAHEIAEGAKGKAGAVRMVWEAIAPLLEKVFLGALR